MHKVNIIIVNWNGKHFLHDCLTSVLQQSYKDFKIIFVDNGSQDKSIEFVRNNFPDVEIIALSENYGFARANNIAIKKSINESVEYIALLNNDTKVEKGWLSELVKMIESNPKIGICASKMLKMDNHKILDAAGHVFKWGTLIDRGVGEIDNGQYDNKLDVIGACGGACLYKVTMLNEIGIFDESYDSYTEDAELSWRAFKNGWKAKFVPASIVYHYRGGTSKSNVELYENMREQTITNMIETIRRHATFKQKLMASTIWWTKVAVSKMVGKWLKRNTTGCRFYFKRLKRIWE